MVSFDGKDYISASRAAKITSYNQDYVGQLARSGKILSRQIGNRWYIEREGLLAHKKEKDGLLGSVQAESVGLVRDSGEAASIAALRSYAGAGPYYAYTTDSGDLFADTGRPRAEKQRSIREESEDSPTVEEVHTIPIRTVTHASARSGSQKRRGYAYRSPRASYGKSIARATKGVAALTIIIMLSYVLTTLKDSGIYATAVDKDGVLSRTAFIANILEVSEYLGESIERLIVPEITYDRRYQ